MQTARDWHWLTARGPSREECQKKTNHRHWTPQQVQPPQQREAQLGVSFLSSSQIVPAVVDMSLHEHDAGSALRRRQRQLRQWLRHERMTVAMALAEATHHAVPRRQKPASVITVNDGLGGQQNAGAEYHDLSSDEEVGLARRMRPALRRIVEQIEEYVPMVQILDVHVPWEGASILAGAGDGSTTSRSSDRGAYGSCLGSRWLLCRRWMSRRPDCATPRTSLWSSRRRRRPRRRSKSWRCPTSPLTRSSTPASASNALAARSRTANKSSTLPHFVEQIVDAAVPQITVVLIMKTAEQLVDVPMRQITGQSWRCPARGERLHDADSGLVPQIMEKITESSAGTLAPMIFFMSPRWPAVLCRRGPGVTESPGVFTPR